jgi:uncharacterized membrane protein YidH (DUF202 family)
MGAITAIVLIAAYMVPGHDIARGWLCAFILISMVPIGSLALLLIHGVTGGKWGDDLSPVLIPAARSIPLLILAILPILLFRSRIYPWPSSDVPPDVAHYYLNPVFFDARALMALTIWSGLAWGNAWAHPRVAALGLVVHLVLMTFIPADWILTIQPHTASAAFGLGFGIEQLFAALAFAALVPSRGRDAQSNRDLAGMLIAALLGTVYFLYMQFLITWYGNIPARVEWYMTRADESWSATIIASFAFGAIVPFLAMLSPAVRQNSVALRWLGASVLIGIALHVIWLTAPIFGAVILMPALLALLLMLLVVTKIFQEGALDGGR